jgi:hypothetical protein
MRINSWKRLRGAPRFRDADDRSRISRFNPLSACWLLTLAIVVVAFLSIALLNRDVALVAIGAMLGGMIYSTVRALA